MSRWLWTLRSLLTGEGARGLWVVGALVFSEGEALDFKLHNEVACCVRDQKKKKIFFLTIMKCIQHKIYLLAILKYTVQWH